MRMQTPDCGQLFRTNDLVSSPNKLQGKGGERRILQFKRPSRQINHQQHVPYLDPDSNKLQIYEATGYIWTLSRQYLILNNLFFLHYNGLWLFFKKFLHSRNIYWRIYRWTDMMSGCSFKRILSGGAVGGVWDEPRLALGWRCWSWVMGIKEWNGGCRGLVEAEGSCQSTGITFT